MEVHRIRAGDESAVVVVGIEHLHGQRFPSAGRAAVHEARPALLRHAATESAELFLDGWDELSLDGFAVGTDVGRVHCVAVVIERVRMLQLDDQKARLVWLRPVLEVLVRFLLLDAVVAGKMKALGVVGLQIRVRRRLAKIAEAGNKVIVKDQQWIVRCGMGVETFRHHHDG